jgi:hypothetical protein
VALANELLELLVSQDDVLEREPFTIAAYRLGAGRLGDPGAAVLTENPKSHQSIVAERGAREQYDGWWSQVPASARLLTVSEESRIGDTHQAEA